MALKVYARHGGAAAAAQDDITARVPFLDGVPGTPIVQMGMGMVGAASQGTVLIPDPTANDDASLYLPPHTQITLTEDATGDELMLAQGRLSGFTIGRAPGSEIDDAVEWTLTVDNANRDLSGLAFTEDWVRPAETGTARLYALALYTLNGTSSTRPNYGGVITYRPSTTIVISSSHLAPDTETTLMPAKTYPADTEPLDVVNDCKTTEGKDFGVVPHHVGGVSHLCGLYIKESDHSTYPSMVKISDQFADWDPDDLTAPVFEPIWDQGKGQKVDGNANISGLVSRWGQGDNVLVSVSAALGNANEYWNEPYQDGASVDLTQAQARAASIIAYRSPFQETDSVSIEMLPEQHHLITAGMSIQIKTAVVAAGTVSTLGTYVDRRIVDLVWEPRANGKLHAIMQLNRPKGLGYSGGQAQPASTSQPSVVSPCPCIETFNRTVAADGGGLSDLNGQTWVIDTVLGDISVDGSELVFDYAGQLHLPILTAMDNSRFEMLLKARIEGPTPADPRGSLDFNWSDSTGGAGPGAGASFTVRARETGATNTELAVNVVFAEDGVGVANGFDFGWVLIYPYVSGGEDFYVHLSVDRNILNASIWLASGSEPDDWMMTLDGAPPVNYNNSNGLVDRLTLLATNTSSSEWHVDFIQILAGMWCCDRTPAAGQFVTDMVIGYADGTSTVYHAPTAAYEAGSLQVWLDGIEQTSAVSESDPTTGEFEFSFVPDASELITVSYQVA